MAIYIKKSFQVPNELVDQHLSVLSINALKCYLIILRKTIGWGKEYDAISAGQFRKLTGIRKSDTIWTAIRQLKELGLIEDISVPGKPTQFKVVIQSHLCGDTQIKGVPCSGGFAPPPNKGNTSKRGTQNSSSVKLIKVLEEEDEVYIGEIVNNLISTRAFDGLPDSIIDQAIDMAVFKLAKKSPAGFRKRLMQGLDAGDQGTINTVAEYIKQIGDNTESPRERIKRLKCEQAIVEINQNEDSFSEFFEKL